MLKSILVPFAVLVAFSMVPVASQQQHLPHQPPARIKPSPSMDMETMLSRILPFNVNWIDSQLYIGRNDFDARYILLKSGFSNKLIVPAQEQVKTSVPFKGWITREGIAKEGTVKLVLKIYDQSSGGTKLYEATHEVEVTHGQYFAIIQVPSETIAKSQTIWLEAEGVEDKEGAFEPRQSFATGPPEGVVPNATAIVDSVKLCYTCGSYWYSHTGAIPVPGGNPMEYGASCSGSLQTRVDYRPFLCTRLILAP